MAEAFMGYLLPWGNMSYWGAQVIVSLFGTVPVIGDSLAEWIKATTSSPTSRSTGSLRCTLRRFRSC